MTLVEPTLLASATAGLLLAQAAVTDTIVAVAAPSSGLDRWIGLMSGIGTIVIALALILTAVALLLAAWNTRKLYKRLSGRFGELSGEVRPMIGHATDVMENVNYVSSAVRQDVERLQATVHEAQERLNRTAAATEQRISEFNALLKVVQEEAEDLFIGTASTVRGVRAGSEAYRRLGNRAEHERHEDGPVVLPRRGAAPPDRET